MIVVDWEEIIEISADLLRRVHGSIEIKLRAIRKDRRQAAGLDLGSHIELCLRCRELPALDVGYHAVHDDQRHQNDAVLGGFAEAGFYDHVFDQR